MTQAFALLARRRAVGVGLALVVECALLAFLGSFGSSAVVGLPAAVAASIAGTVAVVFGPLDGAGLAFAGAVVFGTVVGWRGSELATLVLWPATVTGAGLVGRRVERHKRLLRGVLASHEDERERLALELHDQVAQALTSALLMLPRGDATSTAQTSDNAAHAQELIQQSIRELRDMAVELRPKALDHFGLEPAIARLAADASAGGSLRVRVGPGWDTRLQPEHERDLFRIAQEIVRAAVNDGEGSLWLGLETSTGHATIVASQTGKPAERHTEPRDLALLAERIRLLGGQFHHTAVDGTAMIVADLPLSSS